MNVPLLSLIGFFMLLALGSLVYAVVGVGTEKVKKRITAIARPSASNAAANANQQRRHNMQAMLKELEKQQAEHKKRPSLRRRIEQAGLTITPRTYWTMSIIAGVAPMLAALLSAQSLLIAGLVVFACGIGLPRWVLHFLKNRREKAFTREFAAAIDVIVRSVKSGLPVNEALKVVGSEIPEPVGSEFRTLTDGLKVGVTMEKGLKRMFERMPTAEVNFFMIVMTIQQKSGGNLSEALQNLANMLRARKRMHGKIRAMSSEAKASAMIIGSLPPGVLMLLYFTSPSYITLLFTTQLGNLMLVGCVLCMGIGVLVMKKMISFKF